MARKLGGQHAELITWIPIRSFSMKYQWPKQQWRSPRQRKSARSKIPKPGVSKGNPQQPYPLLNSEHVADSVHFRPVSAREDNVTVPDRGVSDHSIAETVQKLPREVPERRTSHGNGVATMGYPPTGNIDPRFLSREVPLLASSCANEVTATWSCGRGGQEMNSTTLATPKIEQCQTLPDYPAAPNSSANDFDAPLHALEEHCGPLNIPLTTVEWLTLWIR